jgi:hypothetical protein
MRAPTPAPLARTGAPRGVLCSTTSETGEKRGLGPGPASRSTPVLARLVRVVVLFVTAAAAAAEKTTYDDHVLPVLRNRCLNCHNPDKKKASFDASTYTTILAGGGSGKVLVPGDPAASLLWKLINHLQEPNMPPSGPKLPDAELALFKQWIEGGLLENAGSKVATGKPQPSLALATVTVGKPEGPPPFPNGDLRLEPVVHTARPGAIPALAAAPWAPLLALAGQKQILLYNLDTLDIEGILPFPEGFLSVLRFSRNGRLLLAGGGVGAQLGKVALFDVVTGRRVAEVGNESDTVLAADLAPDQSRVALGGPSRSVRIYATATGELVHTIRKHTDWVTAVAYSPDGVLLATADRNGGLLLWEAETANPYNELKTANPKPITNLDWRDDANLLAAASEDGQIRLWEVENGSNVLTINAHPDGAQAVRFAHDGRLASAGRDRTAKLWDPNGKLLRGFDPLGDIALAVALSHDANRLVAADFTGEVRVWTVADGKLAGRLDPNPPTLVERVEAESRQLAAATAAHRAAVEALAQATSRLDSATLTLNTAEKNLARWRAAQTNLHLLALDNEFATKQAVADTARTKAERLDAVATSAAADLAALRKNLADATNAIAQAQAQADALSPKIATLEKTAADSAAAAKTARESANTASAELARLKAALDQLRTGYAKLRAKP